MSDAPVSRNWESWRPSWPITRWELQVPLASGHVPPVMLLQAYLMNFVRPPGDSQEDDKEEDA